MNERSHRDRPIGVFDSGIGGLTVVHALKQYLPREDILYLGDTARLPYGTKSKEAITRFALQDAAFLARRNVKLIIVACHSVSSVCLSELENAFQIPVIGVIAPGARAAVLSSKRLRIGVIGTYATISSSAYERAMRDYARNVEIIARPTPLFVPLVEEGWLDNEITELVVDSYLAPIKRDDIDTLLLGCTHYPLLKPVIHRYFSGKVALVDSSEETAREALRTLNGNSLEREDNPFPSHRFYLSDLTPHFREIAERFLGEPLEEVIRVTVPEGADDSNP